VSRRMISIIMPSYNLGETITTNILKVRRVMDESGFEYELIVVDDGSNDNTYENAKSLEDYNIRVYRHEKNRGKGAAILTGIDHAMGDIIVFFDADLDIDPRQIPYMIKYLEQHRVDGVITSKYLSNTRIEQTLARKFFSKGFNILVKAMFGLDYKDTQTGAKAFRRRVLDTIRKCFISRGYAFDVELLYLATRKNYRVDEVPSPYGINHTSRVTFDKLVNMFAELLRLFIYYRVLRRKC